MKRTIAAIAMCCALMSVSAQSTRTITGAVIDKNGNPLPGATVEATGGAETVTVDADGTFSIDVPIWLKKLTASYAGMGEKKMSIGNRDRVIFELKPEKKSHWFVNAATAADFQEWDEYVQRLGVMGGKLGNWGFYGKILQPLWGESMVPSISAGVIKGFNNVFFPFVGLGYTQNTYWAEDYYTSYYYDYYYEEYRYTSYYYDYPDNRDALLIDLGFLVRFNHFNAGAALGISQPFDTNSEYENTRFQVTLTLGYCF